MYTEIYYTKLWHNYNMGEDFYDLFAIYSLLPWKSRNFLHSI